MSILPDATIGILGGGQLGRMTALAARAMGYRVRALDPDPRCPARGVVDECIEAAFDDADAAARLARACDVVTVEIERVAPAAMDAASRFAPVRPGIHVFETVQDRGVQKKWLAAAGFPVAAFRHAGSAAELARAVDELGGACYVKAARGGYDGRGQVRVAGPHESANAWAALGTRSAVVERAIDIDLELSVLVARRPGGQTVVYPPALNRHRDRILEWSVMPAPVSDDLALRAQGLARSVAARLGVVGLLVVEMFVSRDGRLLVNELAPRPHNSYHASERACVTGQFEQLVRAVCDLPLGSAEIVQPAAIVNLLGELWDGGAPDFGAALEVPGARVHLYGKAVAAPGRKMGHLSSVGSTSDEALTRAVAARTRIEAARELVGAA